MATLTTLAEVKKHLAIPDPNVTQDDRITAMLEVADSWIKQHCNRDFAQAAKTDYHDGRGQNEILLTSIPVASISAIYFDVERVFDASTLVDADEYSFEPESGSVRFHKRRIPYGSKRVKVEYLAGYITTPAPVAYAAKLYVEWLYSHRDDRRMGITSKSKQEENVSYTHALPKEIEVLLAPYVQQVAYPTWGVQNS